MTSASTDFRSRRASLRLTAVEAVALIIPTRKFSTDQIAATAPEGDGHCVLVLPALIRGDLYTAHVRRFLTSIGYSVHGWNLGMNIGPTKRLLDGAEERLIELSDEHGSVSIVGFSMSGLFARWLALRMPDRVRDVITVCSPIHEPARNFCLPFRPFLGRWRGVDLHQPTDDVAQPLSVGDTFLFSRDDGLVNYAACWDASVPPEDNISGPHVLIGCNPQVMSILTARLARRRRCSADLQMGFHCGSSAQDRLLWSSNRLWRLAGNSHHARAIAIVHQEALTGRAWDGGGCR